MLRSPELQNFFDATHEVIASSNAGSAARALADRIFNRLKNPGDSAFLEPVQLPTCDYLLPALDHAREQGGVAQALADALDGIAPHLVWAPRTSGRNDDPRFAAHHANAEVVGKNGLEISNDVWIGISLLAPNTQYPDHRHPPEEIYAVLSPGDWRQQDTSWHSPGIGGVVHNPPNIIHGMRSKAQPLLTVWCLWTG